MTCLKTFLSTKEIQKSFSLAARQYDELSGFHQQFARSLTEETHAFNPQASQILDVGCGTGYLAAQAKHRHPHARVIGIDFSSGMIAQANKNYNDIHFILADARQMPFADESFDLVLSNFAFQWMPDLSEALCEARRVLTVKGQMHATLFGEKTCEELFGSLEHAGFNVDHLNRFVSVSEVGEQLRKAEFSDIQVEEEIIKMPFKDLFQLLFWLKAIGANKLSPRTFIGLKTLQRANDYCLKNFSEQKNMLISFEIIKIQAFK